MSDTTPNPYAGLRIRIGPHKVPVEVRHLEDEYGLFEEKPMKVVLSAELDPVMRASVLIHETIHLLDAIHGLGLSENKVRALEAAIVLAIIQNPEVVALLVRDLRTGSEV